jgi:hypothetical protein
MNAVSPSPSRPMAQSGNATTANTPGASAILTPLTASHAAAIEARGLDPELLAKHGVGASDRLPGDCIGIPFFDNGVRVATKYRTLTGEKRFTQDAGGRQILWNIDCLRDATLADRAADHHRGRVGRPGRAAGGFPRSVSVPGGAPCDSDHRGRQRARSTATRGAGDLLKDCREIILAVDSDGPGANLLHDLSLRLGRNAANGCSTPRSARI